MIGDEPYLPYDRPPLSKQFLTGAWAADRLSLRTSAGVADLDLLLGTAATGLDPGERTVEPEDSSSVPYDGLIIATGVRPRRLPGEGVHTLRTLDDALALRDVLKPGRWLVVVGAGFLGAEVAVVARQRDYAVTLLEPASLPMAHAVGDEVGRMLTGAHMAHDVDLRCGVTVTDATGQGVRLEDGELIDTDGVLVAVGSLPNAVWAEGIGLGADDRAVSDEHSQAAPNVYVAGDVARWHSPAVRHVDADRAPYQRRRTGHGRRPQPAPP
ncbi:NAD(P)/FAD-dependent oxidoreductase [Streptomyces sp. L7]